MATDNSTTHRCCKGCGKCKPDSEWVFQTKRDRGTIRKVRRCCKECLLRKNRQQFALLKQDPIRLAKYRQQRREQRRRISYGVTEEQYAAMLEEHKGVCAICRQPETHRRPRNGPIICLSVDHDHQTGKVRGLLCHSCNVGIGRFQDDPALMQTAIDYLLRHGSSG